MTVTVAKSGGVVADGWVGEDGVVNVGLSSISCRRQREQPEVLHQYGPPGAWCALETWTLNALFGRQDPSVQQTWRGPVGDLNRLWRRR